MATIEENLTTLINAKTAIANAITTKGGTVSQGDGFEDFATDIGTIPSGGAYKLSFTSSTMGNTVTIKELYSINSNSSTSVFGYFVLIPKFDSLADNLTFSFDSAFTPSFTSVKLNKFSSSVTGVDCSGSISNKGKYNIGISVRGGFQIGVTYTIYIQTLFV